MRGVDAEPLHDWDGVKDEHVIAWMLGTIEQGMREIYGGAVEAWAEGDTITVVVSVGPRFRASVAVERLPPRKFRKV